MSHELEKLFNAPAEDILDAIMLGFRTQVDVKGKLAELYLLRILQDLEKAGKIDGFKRQDKDGEPDFIIYHKGKAYKMECKNLRHGEEGIYQTPSRSYKVEIQKTRNSKDGSNTRHYRTDYFYILAVCMFNQTGKWDFYFIRSSHLEVQKHDPDRLEIMQRVPIVPKMPWSIQLTDLLD